MATNILVTGASGYIGQQVAIALRTAGYKVYGLVRSAEKATHLVRHEVIPVVGDVKDLATFRDALAAASVVVDTVPPDWTIADDTHSHSRNLLHATAKSGAAQGVTKTFIYTSGVLVYTHSEKVRDESHSVRSDDLAPFFKQRVAFEEEVVNHTGARGVVIRPGFVFGGAAGAGNHLVGLFEHGTKDKIVINNAIRNIRWNWVHVADLADAYVRAVAHTHNLKGEVFNIVGNSTPTYEELLLASAKVAGFKGTVEYTDEKSSDWLVNLASKTVVLSNHKAFNLLGWRPNHLGVLDELDLYYHTIKGSW